MSKSAYGGELRLVSQIITLANKFGDAEQMLKALAGNRELLAFVLDCAAFNHGQSFTVQDEHDEPVLIRLVCFSETSAVWNDEVNQRVERFGRYATAKELEQLFNILKNDERRYRLCYPIVTHAIPLSYRAETYEYAQISMRTLYASIEFENMRYGGLGLKKTGILWSPATFFAVVPRQQQDEVVLLSSRPKSDE